MAFFIVYIEEAHASDVLPIWNPEVDIVIPSPQSWEERRAVACEFVRNLDVEIPALVDDFKNSAEIAYNGWPSRLYVIDRDGRVAYKSKSGPLRPQELLESLRQQLPSAAVVS